MGWGDIVSRAGKNYTKQVNTNAIGFESTDFWHRLNATRQIKCTSLHYVAFNLPTVAFTLSGDHNDNDRRDSSLLLNPNKFIGIITTAICFR
jgi:hypothetical protein